MSKNKITYDQIQNGVFQLPITDGSARKNGQKWNYEQSVELGNMVGADWTIIDTNQWYFILNDFYSLFYQAGKNYSEDGILYAQLSLCWFYRIDGKYDDTINLIRRKL